MIDDIKGANLLLEYFNIKSEKADLFLLKKLLDKFSLIPYENATKIIKSDGTANFYNSFRFPFEVVTDHIQSGSGGTCFSLVHLFKTLLDQCGFNSKLILADRTYGDNTHTAIIVKFKDTLYLADPGYMVFKPLKLSKEKPVLHNTGIANLLIEPLEGGQFFNVYTLNNNKKFRYRLKNEKVKRDIFFEAWKRSFEFEMMNYLIITRVSQGEHIYMRNNYLQYKTETGITKKKINTQKILEITSQIGISKEIISKALKVLGKNV